MTGGGLWVVTPTVHAAVAGGELSIAVGMEQLEVASVSREAGGVKDALAEAEDELAVV